MDGGGGGGRLAIYYAPNTFNGAISAAGSTGFKNGSAGTVFMKAADRRYGSLVVDNGGVDAKEDTTFIRGTHTFESLTVLGKARLQNPSAARVTAKQTLRIVDATFSAQLVAADELTLTSGARLTHPNATATITTSLQLSVATVISISLDSAIDVNGRGYQRNLADGIVLFKLTSNRLLDADETPNLHTDFVRNFFINVK